MLCVLIDEQALLGALCASASDQSHMEFQGLNDSQLGAYFCRIGLPDLQSRRPAADLNALQQIHRAHTSHIAWENLSCTTWPVYNTHAKAKYANSLHTRDVVDKLVFHRRGEGCLFSSVKSRAQSADSS